MTSVLATVITGTALMLGGAGQSAAAERTTPAQRATQGDMSWTAVTSDAPVDSPSDDFPWT
ncbi:hypothetical protein [Streptomyces sp. LBL]|uniref:hypothetical protein n=1 Tax=Streptomyces sp. LBL TaxID=2940562 RepID=UPI002476CEE7|nr:hypothetical protein [Streptomyces sp. LBL]